ncbi:hypothetical protein cypCar_00014470 [Cyprinus carpio]|nr:hypothetical protein cypCar_00014470 [Cyprinus carpio]
MKLKTVTPKSLAQGEMIFSSTFFVDIHASDIWGPVATETTTQTSTGSIGQGPAAGEMSGSSHATETDGNQDSYLKRYYRTLPEEKRLMLEKSLMNANNDQAHVSGVGKGRSKQNPSPKKDTKHRTGADAEDNEGKESKKSSTCIML